MPIRCKLSGMSRYAIFHLSYAHKHECTPDPLPIPEVPQFVYVTWFTTCPLPFGLIFRTRQPDQKRFPPECFYKPLLFRFAVNGHQMCTFGNRHSAGIFPTFTLNLFVGMGPLTGFTTHASIGFGISGTGGIEASLNWKTKS